MNYTNSQNQLSKEEKEVWKTVEKYTSLIMKGDIKGFLKYFHKDYSGWNYKAFLPVRKDDIKHELLHLPKRKIHSYKIIPLAISVLKDTAVVHYSYSVIYLRADGSKVEKSGNNTDVLLRQKTKWVIIADHVRASNKNVDTNLQKEI